MVRNQSCDTNRVLREEIRDVYLIFDVYVNVVNLRFTFRTAARGLFTFSAVGSIENENGETNKAIRDGFVTAMLDNRSSVKCWF